MTRYQTHVKHSIFQQTFLGPGLSDTRCDKPRRYDSSSPQLTTLLQTLNLKTLLIIFGLRTTHNL